MPRLRSKRLPPSDYSDYYDDDYQGHRPKRRRREARDPDEVTRMPWWVSHLFILAMITAVLLALVWLVAGWPMLEKTLTALVAPLGLLWCGLILALYFCFYRRQGTAAFFVFAGLLILTLSGNSIVSNILGHSLQKEYVGFDYQDMEKLDLLVVLGGGQSSTLNGKAQLSGAGDRPMMAARILINDKADRVICSGSSSLPLAKNELNQADALEQILLSLKVSDSRILKIGGRNTLEEIRALDRWLSENNGKDLKVGILTSAWHMPRAIRLAESVGVNAVAVPADFANTRFRQTPHLLVPGAVEVNAVSRYTKEYLAKWMGR